MSLFSSMSLAFTTISSGDCVRHQEFMRQEPIFASPENEEKLAAVVTGASLISKAILFVVKCSFELHSVDIILQYSRRSNEMEGCLKAVDVLSAKNFDEVPTDGIWISVHRTCFKIFCEGGKLEVHTDLSQIHSVVYCSQSLLETSIDLSELGTLLQQSLDCLYEASLSNLAFTFYFAFPENIPSSGSVTNLLDGFGDISSLSLNQASGFASTNLEPGSNHWLLIDISVGEIFLARSTMKNILAGAHQIKKLLSSLSAGGELQTISWAVQVLILWIKISIFFIPVAAFHLYLFMQST